MEGLSVLALLVVWALDISVCMPNVSEISCPPLPSPPWYPLPPQELRAVDIQVPTRQGRTRPCLPRHRPSAIRASRQLLCGRVVSQVPPRCRGCAPRTPSWYDWTQSCVSIVASAMNRAIQTA